MFENQTLKGSRFLDEKLPGWFNKIDIRSLNLANEYHCIVGQLYGNYTVGIYDLFTSYNCPVDYGFSLCGVHNSNEMIEWDFLRDAWITEINYRIAIEKENKNV